MTDSRNAEPRYAFLHRIFATLVFTLPDQIGVTRVQTTGPPIARIEASNTRRIEMTEFRPTFAIAAVLATLAGLALAAAPLSGIALLA
jgi:hypothetical protein